jgi:hypothetical protein
LKLVFVGADEEADLPGVVLLDRDFDFVLAVEPVFEIGEHPVAAGLFGFSLDRRGVTLASSLLVRGELVLEETGFNWG